MMNKKQRERLEKIENLNKYLNDLIDMIPVNIPQTLKEKIMGRILENDEIRDLIEKVKGRRPPRLVLVGRTGSGKSTLINAMFGEYLAETSDVEVGTTNSSKFEYKKDGETVIEIIDTRGIGESKNNNQAEEDLEKTIKDFNPDAILFLAKAKERAHIEKDIKSVKNISAMFNDRIPVIGLRTQVDELEPSRYKDPERYPERKIKNINKSVEELEKILSKNSIDVLEILPVSAYIEWNMDPEKIDNYDDLEMEFTGFYNIDKLLNVLEDNMELEAAIFLKDYNELVKTVSRRLIKGFSGAAGAIGATPIPTSDLFVLTPLQAILVSIIAYLSGRDISYEHAKEFMGSFGLVGGAGVGLQQAAKVLNVIPGLGSAVSGGIAAGGTYAIGEVAYQYYCLNKNIEELKDTFIDKVKKRKANYNG